MNLKVVVNATIRMHYEELNEDDLGKLFQDVDSCDYEEQTVELSFVIKFPQYHKLKHSQVDHFGEVYGVKVNFNTPDTYYYQSTEYVSPNSITIKIENDYKLYLTDSPVSNDWDNTFMYNVDWLENIDNMTLFDNWMCHPTIEVDSHYGCYCKTKNVCGCGCDPLHDGW